MHSIPPEATRKIAVITGVNGYIASVIAFKLLHTGYTVRGTARSYDSTNALQRGVFKPFGNRFQPFEVEDITAPGAFDEVVDGAHIIIHCASPVTFDVQPWSFFRDPAINGTTGILDSAARRAGQQLASVVITSSAAAVFDLEKPAEYVNTEADWNESVLNMVERQGDDAPAANYYAASKAAGERAVWRWREINKPLFAVACLNPSIVIGPPVQAPSHPSKLNLTLQGLWKMFSGELKEVPGVFGSGSFVDVRDVATAHIWAAEHPAESNGKRFIVTAGFGPPQAQADILREAYPDRKQIPVGTPGQGYVPGSYDWPEGVGPRLSGAYITSLSGLEYTSLQRSVLDTALVFETAFKQYL